MDNLLVVSNVVLWLAVFGLAVLVFALARQVGALYDRIAPAGALMINQQINVGDPAPRLVVESLDGDTFNIGGAPDSGRSQLWFFLTPDCPICKSLLSVLRSVRRTESWIDIILASDGGNENEHREYVVNNGLVEFPYVLSENLGRSFGVGKLPYAVVIDEDGLIASLGIVNSREHLESLFEAKERAVGSVQEYMAKETSFYDADSSA